MTPEKKRQFSIAYLEHKIKVKENEISGRIRYDASMKSGALWFLKALELKYSSDALHRCEARNYKRTFSFESQELLLLGFSFELLFKSFYISNNGTFPKKIKTHELTDLAREANISLNFSDKILLKRLSKVVWWQGRYPCALNPPESFTEEFPKSDLKAIRSLWRKCCKKTPDAIVIKLMSLINKGRKP